MDKWMNERTMLILQSLHNGKVLYVNLQWMVDWESLFENSWVFALLRIILALTACSFTRKKCECVLLLLFMMLRKPVQNWNLSKYTCDEDTISLLEIIATRNRNIKFSQRHIIIYFQLFSVSPPPVAWWWLVLAWTG